MLFDNSLNDKRFRIDIRVENGYKESCTRGARRHEAISGNRNGPFVLQASMGSASVQERRSRTEGPVPYFPNVGIREERQGTKDT